jgi:hypothetical protein
VCPFHSTRLRRRRNTTLIAAFPFVLHIPSSLICLYVVYLSLSYKNQSSRPLSGKQSAITSWFPIKTPINPAAAAAGMDGRVEENGRGCHGGADVSEWKKVAELRAVAEAQDPAAKVSAPSVVRLSLLSSTSRVAQLVSPDCLPRP